MNATINNNVADGAAGSGGGILNDAGGTLTVSASTINGNTSVRAGGGIEDNASTTSLNGVILSGNETGDSPGNGGGLHISGAGTATVTDSTVQNNTATEGGGLWNAGAGTLTVDGSTLNNNTADGTADGQDGGGAIYNDGMLTVVNSTVSGNSAPTGGGISNVGGNANATVVNSTLYENSQGGINNNGGSLGLNQSIVAHVSATGDDCTGTITAMNANLDSDGTCGASLTGNTLLGALADNSGSTQTHALMAGSPALEAGDNAVCAASPVNGVDQRNMERPQGMNCDLGAYESDSPTAIVINDISANNTSTLPFALLAMGMAGAVIGLIWRRRRTA